MKYIKNNIVYDEYRGIPNADGKLVLGMTRAEILSLGYSPFFGNDLDDDGRTNEFCLEPYYIDFYSLYGETEALTQDVVLDIDLDDAVTAYENGRELVIRYWGELPEGSTDLRSIQESGEARINAVYYFSNVDSGNLIFRSSFPVNMIDSTRYTKSNYNCVTISTGTNPKVLSFYPASDTFVSISQVEELVEEEYVDLTKNAQGNIIVNSGSSSADVADYVRYVESSSPNITRIFRRVSSKNESGGPMSISGNTASYVFSEINGTSNSTNILVCTLGQGSVVGGDWELKENIADTPKMIEVTYDELKTLRSESNLKPGTWYRLTDYRCTVFTENKRSLNHQFDIVILALNKNTLSEECRAVIHERIYDVIFSQASVYQENKFKCYVYQYDDSNYSIVRCSDRKSLTVSANDITIDESNKSVTFNIYVNADSLGNNNYPIDYFQEGWNRIDGLPSYCKVKSWKIWYTLDNINGSNNFNQEYSILNVTATVMGETMTFNTHRQIGGWFSNGYTDSDTGTTYYPWVVGSDSSSVDFWTTTTDISTGSYTIYMGSAPTSESAVPVNVILNSTMVIPKGKGTVYRMIDEYGNDCPYDFKNIQFSIDLDGTPTWVYTFTANVVTLGIIDGSLSTYGPSDPQNYYIQVRPSTNNIIKSSSGPIVMFHSDGGQYTEEESEVHSYNGSNGNFIGEGCYDIILYGGWDNKFESYCREIKLKGSYNRFERNCNNIELAEDNSYNTFAQNCNNIKFLKNWTQYITVEPNVSYVNLTSSGTTAYNNKLQYITISKGFKGSSGNPRVITHTTLNDTFKTIYQDEGFILKGEVNSVSKEVNLLTLDSSGGSADLTNYYTKTQSDARYTGINNNPIIEDTRSSGVVAITGVAPFASLVDKQRIILHSNYINTGSGAYTLNLTLSDGTTTTGAKNIKYITLTNTWDNAYGNYIQNGVYLQLTYDATKDAWLMENDRDHDIATMTQTDITNGTATTPKIISASMLRSNFYTEGEVDTLLLGKQDTLTSGTDIKTINSNSILGSGDLSVGTITSVKMNGSTVSSSGEADLGTIITSETSLSKGTATGAGNAVTDISVSGHQITLTKGKTFLESFTETDPVFSASAAAGISSSDITNWNSKTSNTGTVTGVKMNGTTNNPTSGVVDLGTVITSETSLSKGSNSGSGNAVTDISVSGHQITLTKGKTFLESFTETDPVFSASAAAGITSSDITNWNGKTNNTGTVTGVKMNGSTNNPTNGVVDLGTIITSETSLSKGSTSGAGNAVTDISVSGHQITLTKGSTFLTSETSLSKGTTAGSGNAVTDISVSGHQITLTKGSTFLTEHQSLKTINGNSIIGTGDLTISGGSGSGLPSVTSSDNGKILQVVNGAWTLVSPVTLYSGSSTPNNAQGNNGDLYAQS